MIVKPSGRILLLVLALVTSLVLLPACAPREKTVTIYTSVDRNFSELVFEDFEKKTGIKVIAGYDTEASKTTGLVNKLIEEAKQPAGRCVLEWGVFPDHPAQGKRDPDAARLTLCS
jgi:hypothetical protein